jgi:hypothetical protein
MMSFFVYASEDNAQTIGSSEPVPTYAGVEYHLARNGLAVLQASTA